MAQSDGPNGLPGSRSGSGAGSGSGSGRTPIAPEAKIIPTEITLGGQKVIDNYWWLRDKSNPDGSLKDAKQKASIEALGANVANMLAKLNR